MRNKLSKVVVVLTAAAMLTVGCSNVATNSTQVGGSEGTDEASEPVEFSSTYIMTDWGGEADNFEVLKTMQEEANVKINWMNYSGTDWTTQKNLVITGGNLPEVFTGQGCLTLSDVVKYASEGMLLDLTDLIPEHMPNLSKLLDENPTLRTMMQNPEDGRIYSLPFVNGRTVSRTQGVHYINKTWLDNLGLEIPTTTEEYYEVLKAFKENDANGNGDPNDEIPFSCYANRVSWKGAYGYYDFFGFFGHANTGESITPNYVRTETGDIVFVPETEGYKEAIQYMHRLVSEGLWDVESFTFTALPQLVAKGGTSPATLGSFVGYEKQFVVSAENLDQYVPLKTLIGPNGDQARLENKWNSTDMGQLQTNTVELTIKAKGKEAEILGFYDLCYDPEYAAQIFLGAEGSTISKNADGMFEYNETPEGVTWSEFRYKNAPVWFPFALLPEDWGTVVEKMEEDVMVDEILVENYDDFLAESSLYIVPTIEESKVMNSTGEDIKNYIDLTQAQWIVEGGIEEEWDSYLASLETLGLAEYTELVKEMAQRME